MAQRPPRTALPPPAQWLPSNSHYTALRHICPFAHRVELALQEAKAGYNRFEVDLSNKPEWYAAKINPESKARFSFLPVPAIAFGGPQVSPDLPSPDSAKLAESLVLVEFVADLYPASTLLPRDPVQRAKVRFFIEEVSNRFLPAYMGPLARGQPWEPLWNALDVIQRLLPDDKTYAVGDDFTAADIAIAPFLARLEVMLRHDIGAYPAGEGTKAAEYFFDGGRFTKLLRYYDAIKARESLKNTFDAEYIRTKYTARFIPIRAKLQAEREAAAANA
ncbi:Glutathione S-transferase [Mycena indigotica]|uniref:Glutathione S-transferase n=1 Tax=Mycena indigotica TaxID=2126181 RepID=A0A8H6VVV7_9AGAR|nr:Glutathione S-transferase [Mycena indigotica]KAF7292038.1 Glutathione S-transferase [Mycena indigotica]